jgi:hypothetical protein
MPLRVDRSPAPEYSDFPIEAVLGICMPMLVMAIVGVTLIIAINKRKMQRDDMEATLKMEMIQRGMTADDIERVLAARIGPPRHGGCKHPYQHREEREFQPR